MSAELVTTPEINTFRLPRENVTATISDSVDAASRRFDKASALEVSLRPCNAVTKDCLLAAWEKALRVPRTVKF
jgi:hypothetical protein